MLISRRIVFLTAMFCLASLAGCAINRTTATADEMLNWGNIKVLHVKQLEGEDGSTKTLIAEKLRASGFRVTSDPEPTGQPDAIVTYVDRWSWDITMYMIELTITLRDPKTNNPIAMGNSYHTSLTRKSQKEMVDEVIESILKQRK